MSEDLLVFGKRQLTFHEAVRELPGFDAERAYVAGHWFGLGVSVEIIAEYHLENTLA